MGLTAHKRSTTTIIAQQSHPPSGSAYWLQFDRQAESFLFPSIDLPQRGAEGEQQPAVLNFARVKRHSSQTAVTRQRA
ncbi:uncharacterized protein PITG_03116 [Phytophthora infestans T30-4]|uniref:Uncharacterized protein n=1 Tax=Phytophthora infestans (strain T30-4) TaxID=403677 RepID=D0MZE7_PHYIT|nr:uncharacterized protein PITG_03116 [Phytophthora infestans T30-4]EEY65610.1 hypothetical protein PITG_03116 [Phytophthora infestans T30-4]|eukprot:XP_002906209.1 hypothetical protein PITG_03116 [Phytophthora infestans T30-4]